LFFFCCWKMFALTRAIPRHSSMLSRALSSAKTSSGLGSFVAADQTITQNRVYHKTHYAVLALVPIALAAHPSALSMPVDVALAIALPLHAHIGMNWIFTDYVPGSPSGAARIALLTASTLAALGLLKLSVSGPGIVGTVKEMWTGAEETKKQKKAQ